MEFSKLLIQRRKELGFSQETLAEKIQVSRQAISKWENGDSYPDLPKLISLSNVLDISLDQLCGLNKEKKKETSKIEIKKNNKKVLLMTIILISFLLGNLFPKIGVTAIPEDIEIIDISLKFIDEKLNLGINTDLMSNKFSYYILFTSIESNTVNKKYPLECEDGICKFSLNLDEISNPKIQSMNHINNTNISLIISNGVDSKSILIIKDLKYYNGDASWNSVYY